MANVQSMPIKMEQLLILAGLKGYWEIRDPYNQLLIAKKPETGEITITKGNDSHNNPEGLAFKDAIALTIEKTKSLFPVLIVKFATSKTATNTFQYYQVNTVEHDEEDTPIAGFAGINPNTYQQPPMYMPMGAFPYGNQQGQNQPQNQQEQYFTFLAGMQQTFNNRLAELDSEYKFRMKERELEERERRFLEAAAKLEEEKELLKDKLEDKSPNWNKLGEKFLDNAPAILNGFKGWVDMLRPSTPTYATMPLAGVAPVATKTESSDTAQVQAEKKKPTVSFKKKGETPVEVSGEVDSVKKVVLELSQLEEGLSAEEIEALKVMAYSLKEGKVSTDEVKDFARSPETFFAGNEEEKTEE